METRPGSRAEVRTTSRLSRLYTRHADSARRFASLLTEDERSGSRVTDGAFIRLGGRFSDLRHRDTFEQDLRREIVRRAASRRERTGPRRDVLARAAGILRAEGLSDDQVASILDLSRRRATSLAELAPVGLVGVPAAGAGLSEAGVLPTPRLERLWRAARFRTIVVTLLFLSYASAGGWATFDSVAPPRESVADESVLRGEPFGRPTIVARVSLGEGDLSEMFPFNGPSDIAAADGVVWVSGHFGVVGISTATNQIVRSHRRSGVGFGGGLAAENGTVWVAEGNSALIEPPGGLVRIDAATATPNGRFDLTDLHMPHGVAVGEGTVWLAALNIGIYRIDLITMKPVATVPLLNPQAVESGYGSIWAVAGDGSIAKINPWTNSVVTTIEFPAVDLAVGEGAVWAIMSGWVGSPAPEVKGIEEGFNPPLLAAIDPVSGAIKLKRPLTARKIAVGAGAVWAITGDGHTGEISKLLQFDPVTGDLLSQLDLDGSAVDLCVLGDSVWVLDASTRSLVRVDV